MKCSFQECRIKISSLMTMECKMCNGKFCGKHRLLENHLCSGLDKKCNDDKKILENELLNNKCVSKPF